MWHKTDYVLLLIVFMLMMALHWISDVQLDDLTARVKAIEDTNMSITIDRVQNLDTGQWEYKVDKIELDQD